MNHQQKMSHLVVFSANTIFGLGIPITALLLENWIGPMAYMFTRCFGAALIFWLVSFFYPREKMPLRDLAIIAVGGLLGIVVSQTLTAWALVYTTPVYFSLVATLTPMTTMLCAALFISERVSKKGILGILAGVAGAMLLVVMGWHNGTGKNDVLGISLTVLSMLTWAIYLIVTRKVSARYSAMTQMKWVFTVSALVLLPFSWSDMLHARLYSADWQWSGVAEMAFIVLFATVLGYFAIPFAMRHLKVATVSSYTNLQPIVASLVAIALGQDVLTWDKPVALLLVLLSAWLVTRED